jgi:hypothetical protein
MIEYVEHGESHQTGMEFVIPFLTIVLFRMPCLHKTLVAGLQTPPRFAEPALRAKSDLMACFIYPRCTMVELKVSNWATP